MKGLPLFESSADRARDRQREAAAPEASVWVAASAGTGKTTVLTSRVLSLLLAGTPPTRILCLTFTKAAAAEMANRVALRLGQWAAMADKELSQELTDLTGDTPKGDLLERARRLFARVVDAPGGLKIETIHAFCQSVLRRFPLEAGVAPHFSVMEERSAAEQMEAARDEVLAEARRGRNDALAAALACVTGHLYEASFHDLMAAIASERGRLQRALDKAGGLEPAIASIWRALGLAPGMTVERLLREACGDGAFDAPGLDAAAKALGRGSESDCARARAIAQWLAAPDGRAAGFAAYREQFLTKEGQERKSLLSAALAKVAPAEAALRAEAARLLALAEQLKNATAGEASAALMRLAGAVLAAYERHKEERALLDYDDLILKTLQLLEARGADWVLFKLDQGLDHILIDEAQDTNPDQWQVVARLADELFVGEGAQEARRTLFAVGDAKQSIFSFQRADPETFDAMRERFAVRARDAEQLWRDVALDVSFRSVPAILGAIDAVFARPEAAEGVVEPGTRLRHRARREGQAGLVELWPPVRPRGREEPAPWTPPLKREPADSPPARLAALIARRIKGWIESGERLASRDRPIHAGDIMVLVRQRNIFVEELIRALKTAAVPVAGIDRMVLTDQLAVMDVVALARFLLLPEDDLSLACVLKSPLVGLSEEQLLHLCYGREGRLWRALGQQAESEPALAPAHDYLQGLLRRVDYTPPFELLATILGADGAPGAASGRKRLLARLGPDAEEPLDELLQLALDYERGHAPSLQGFLHWLESGQAEIKRDPEASARDEVRVMTVHGAKGLEAPIVILPDMMQSPLQSPSLLWLEGEGGAPLWPPRRAHEGALAQRLRAEANRRRDREYRRLLYVAMTRAADRLYLCGWEGRQAPPALSWYSLARAGLGGLAQPFAFDYRGELGAEGWTGEGLRYVSAQTAPAEPARGPAGGAPSRVPLPGWALRPPPAERVPPRPLAPSRPETEEPALRSPLGRDQGARFRRGLIIHRLLESLPELPPDARAAACARFLARPALALGAAEQEALAAETLAVLAHPEAGALFGPNSRAEQPLTGLVERRVVSGQIDRLVVTEHEVTIVDYKTNRPPPATPEATAPLYLRQMAAYRALLRLIYPGKPVRCLLLWTEGPILMVLPDALLDEYDAGLRG